VVAEHCEQLLILWNLQVYLFVGATWWSTVLCPGPAMLHDLCQNPEILALRWGQKFCYADSYDGSDVISISIFMNFPISRQHNLLLPSFQLQYIKWAQKPDHYAWAISGSHICEVWLPAPWSCFCFILFMDCCHAFLATSSTSSKEGYCLCSYANELSCFIPSISYPRWSKSLWRTLDLIQLQLSSSLRSPSEYYITVKPDRNHAFDEMSPFSVRAIPATIQYCWRVG